MGIAVTGRRRLLPSVAVAALLAATWAPGATAEERSARPSYIRARFLDLLDAFEVGVAAGPGIGVELNCLIGSLGARAAKAWRVRLGQRSVFLYEKSGAYSVIPGYQGWYDLGLCEARNIWPAPASMGTKPRKSTVRLGWKVQEGNLDPFDGPMEGEPVRQLDAGLDVHLLLLGARVRLRLTELVDFVGGLFGADPAGDDLGPRTDSEPDVPPAVPGGEARSRAQG